MEIFFNEITKNNIELSQEKDIFPQSVPWKSMENTSPKDLYKFSNVNNLKGKSSLKYWKRKLQSSNDLVQNVE